MARLVISIKTFEYPSLDAHLSVDDLCHREIPFNRYRRYRQ
jgi:hypothetical protein